MHERQELAISDFDSGFNCSQSVVAAFCEQYGVDKATARKIACGFGGGLRSGEVCGAVSGAVIVIGLKHGQYIAEDQESKSNCNVNTREFIARFKEANGSMLCREILQCDVSTPEGLAQARSKNLFKTVCFDMVRSAVSLLEESGY